MSRTLIPLRRKAAVAVLLFTLLGAASLLGAWAEARFQQKALVDCKSNLKNLAVALEMYSTDASGRYPQQEQRGLRALVPDYLKTLPTCPAGGQLTYAYSSCI